MAVKFNKVNLLAAFFNFFFKDSLVVWFGQGYVTPNYLW